MRPGYVRAVGRLSGKVAVVTGGGQGIGGASAFRMAEAGASVVVADVNLEVAEHNVAAIRDAGGEATAVFVNMADDRSIEALFARVVELYGGLDIAHNNAIGVRPPEGWTGKMSDYVHDSEPAVFDAMLHGTVTVTMLATKHAVPLLIERGGGSIINTASIAGTQGEIYNPSYGAGKAGVIQLTRSTAAMYGRKGVRCNAICPGYILTPSGEKAFDETMKAVWRRHTVIDRHGNADDVAHLAVYLASDESAFMTGQALVIDGGFTMHEPMWADRLDLEP
jgi:NAD(P)-dependent dehydrogenase (short-subunit alcohol dehydrogenase family)